MADVIMEMNGKRKRVPADKVAYFKGKGAKVVPPVAPAPVAHADTGADAAGHPETGEPAAEQSQDDGLPGIVTAPLKAAKWMAGGALLDPSFRAGASKFLTGGFTDDVAGLGARAGTAFGNLTSGVDPSFQEDPAEAARVAREDQRAKEEKAYQANPLAYDQGALTGMVGGAALPIGRGNTFAARAKTAVPAGIVTGYGMSNTEDDTAAMLSALFGGGVGAMAAGIPNAVNAVKEGWPAVKSGAQQMIRGGKNIVANPGEVLDEAPVVGGLIKKGRALFKAGATPPVMSADEAGAVIDVPSPYEGVPWTPPETSSTSSGLKLQPPPATGLVDDLMSTMDAIDRGGTSAAPVAAEAPTVAPPAATPVASVVDDVNQQMANIDNDPLASMRSEVAQDWGTRPPSMANAAGAPSLAPDPDIFAYFMEQTGGDKQKSLAMTYGMMAKMNAGTAGAVGRQRAAVGFDPASPGPAPIATPTGRNRAAAPFQGPSWGPRKR
jgi:hypothetical protein